MPSRNKVIEELKIDYEIPYVSARGEIIDSTTVQVNENRKGVSVSYAMLNPSEQKLKSLFPAEGVDYLVKMIKQILRDLGIIPSRTILQLCESSPIPKSRSVEGRAPVNKQRDTVLIILTKTPFIYKFGYEVVLWHQTMHAKDRWEHRFPSTHPSVDVGEWLDAFWHFSVDGRLQKAGKPHYSISERLDEANRLLEGLCQIDNLQDRIKKICDELWGKEVTFAQLLDIGRDLGLEPNLAPQQKIPNT